MSSRLTVWVCLGLVLSLASGASAEPVTYLELTFDSLAGSYLKAFAEGFAFFLLLWVMSYTVRIWADLVRERFI